MSTFVHAVDRLDLPPLEMPDRFRHDITYFMAIPGEAGIPPENTGCVWMKPADGTTRE